MERICDHRPRPYTVVEDILLECDLSSLLKLTLIALTKFAGKQSTAWPGVETLAKCSSCSTRQLRRTLQELQKQKLLRIQHRAGQSSIYHIPEYSLQGNRLYGIWQATPDTLFAPDTVSAHPGHPVTPPLTPCQGTPDMVSPKHSQEHSQGKSLSSPLPHQADNPPKAKREIDKDDLIIKAWCRQFASKHRPGSPKELIAMDWMLHAATTNQIGEIKSPVAYLKTITRQGHPADFESYLEKHQRKRSQQMAEQSRQQQEQDQETRRKNQQNEAYQRFHSMCQEEQQAVLLSFRQHLLASGNRIVVKTFDQSGITTRMVSTLFRLYLAERPPNESSPKTLPGGLKSTFAKHPLNSPPTPHESPCCAR